MKLRLKRDIERITKMAQFVFLETTYYTAAPRGPAFKNLINDYPGTRYREEALIHDL
jgi:hypothetical protein